MNYRRIEIINHRHMDNKLRDILPKYNNEIGQQIIGLTFMVEEEDLKNIEYIKSNLSKLQHSLESFRNGKKFAIEVVDKWDISLIHPGKQFSYRLVDIIPSFISSYTHYDPYSFFLQYMNWFELFTLLARESGEIGLVECLLYFSPFRGATSPQS